jgi:hypothetical protein
MALPYWIFPTLQGITFWVAHRRSIYPHYPLGESALVAELSNLICSHLPNGHNLKCEQKYSTLSPVIEQDEKLPRGARTDLTVLINKLPKFVFEVKRASASKAAIEIDLHRLAKLKEADPNLLTYLIIISEAKRPKRFVSTSGVGVRGMNSLKGPACWTVRSVKKAAHSFQGVESASYACLIEVFHSI